MPLQSSLICGIDFFIYCYDLDFGLFQTLPFMIYVLQSLDVHTLRL